MLDPVFKYLDRHYSMVNPYNIDFLNDNTTNQRVRFVSVTKLMARLFTLSDTELIPYIDSWVSKELKRFDDELKKRVAEERISSFIGGHIKKYLHGEKIHN